VEFQTIAEADAAIAELNDTSLGGRQIFVREDRGGDGKASGAAGSRVSAATNIGSTTNARTVPRLDAALPSQRDGSGGAARPSGHAG
jgi:RNA recognition motif-containing protein